LCEAAFPVIEGQANSPSTTMHPTKSENLMAFPALKKKGRLGVKRPFRSEELGGNSSRTCVEAKR
jgi:hypothetical protein